MPRIGVKNLYYAILTKDDATGVTYSAPVRIKGVININFDVTTNSNTIYADDIPWETANSFGGATVTIETADLTLEEQAALLGHKFENGGLTRNASDMAPYVAIMFESAKSNGGITYMKLYKGMFKDPKREFSTKKDQPEFKTSTIEGNFIARQYDGKWEYDVDSDDEDAATKISSWYTSVELGGSGNP